MVHFHAGSREGVPEYGAPPTGFFTFTTEVGPRVTVEDFSDLTSALLPNFRCPSSDRFFGELTLTDPNGKHHVFGRGLTIDLAIPGVIGDANPYWDEMNPGSSAVKTCAELEIQGQSLPIVCGTWRYTTAWSLY